jgi:signal transduction histidine kinase/CheY-like chemotaxis protein/HAMP domain-containing protein
MRIKDITIGDRLTMGFGAIIFLVVILGIISYNQAGRLWQHTDDLYNHPLIVGRAARDIESNLLRIHILMKDIALDENLTDDQIRSSIIHIDFFEKEVYEQFDVVYAQYLGSKLTIDSAYNYFKEWKIVRDELISLRITKGYSAAYTRFISVNKGYVENMIAEIEKMITFSNDKALIFYTDAALEKSTLNTRLTIFFIIILISALSILYLLIKIIRSPLTDLVEITDKYRLGEYNARSNYDSQNEIGTVAAAFNKMAESVQADITIQENAAWVAKLMMNENELRPFCKGLMNALINKTESQIAAIYLLNKNSGQYEHFESIGLADSKIKNFSANNAEGEFGPLLAYKKIVKITDIPEDTSFLFPVVTGTFKPREIITVPLIENEEVIAVISLASLKNYSDLSVRFLHDIQAIITARLLGVINYQKIKDFSAVLDVQNRELDQKSKELVMQSDELKEYNIELELQKKQLDDANKLKSSFLSNMSHELRTPLNSVIALSGVLTRRLNGKIPEDEYNYIGIIEKNGKSLLSLINDILDLSRIESGREELNYTQFSMCDLVEDILNSLEPITDEKGIALSCKAPPDLPLLISDKNKCHHIMQNLISNAIKFTDAGSVEISGQIIGENLSISVKDTGVGIREDFLPFVFEEFRQADDRPSRKFGGTGLGLAIVKKYCTVLNGSVEVTSKIGEGSTFTVILPLKPSGIHISDDGEELLSFSGRADKNREATVREGSRKTILLVEDSEPQIIQLTDILKHEGFEIKVARNGIEALEEIRNSIPDAMILDLQMPEVDGFEVLRTIRNFEETRSIPVLVLTAKHITKEDLSFLKGNNIYQLIQKGSINRTELLGYVKNLTLETFKEKTSVPERTQTDHGSDVKSHILVIEDNQDNVVTLKALLDNKFLISVAGNGIEGIQMASSLKPQLILLDISLHGMDGYKVLDELKKDEQLKSVPVVALTARVMKGDREDLLAYGFDGYIAKPIDNETFEKTINEYLGSRQ